MEEKTQSFPLNIIQEIRRSLDDEDDALEVHHYRRSGDWIQGRPFWNLFRGRRHGMILSAVVVGDEWCSLIHQGDEPDPSIGAGADRCSWIRSGVRRLRRSWSRRKRNEGDGSDRRGLESIWGRSRRWERLVDLDENQTRGWLALEADRETPWSRGCDY